MFSIKNALVAVVFSMAVLGTPPVRAQEGAEERRQSYRFTVTTRRQYPRSRQLEQGHGPGCDLGYCRISLGRRCQCVPPVFSWPTRNMEP